MFLKGLVKLVQHAAGLSVIVKIQRGTNPNTVYSSYFYLILCLIQSCLPATIILQRLTCTAAPKVPSLMCCVPCVAPLLVKGLVIFCALYRLIEVQGTVILFLKQVFDNCNNFIWCRLTITLVSCPIVPPRYFQVGSIQQRNAHGTEQLTGI